MMITTDALAGIRSDIKEAERFIGDALDEGVSDDMSAVLAQLAIARGLLALVRASIAEYDE